MRKCKDAVLGMTWHDILIPLHMTICPEIKISDSHCPNACLEVNVRGSKSVSPSLTWYSWGSSEATNFEVVESQLSTEMAHVHSQTPWPQIQSMVRACYQSNHLGFAEHMTPIHKCAGNYHCAWNKTRWNLSVQAKQCMQCPVYNMMYLVSWFCNLHCLPSRLCDYQPRLCSCVSCIETVRTDTYMPDPIAIALHCQPVNTHCSKVSTL